MTAVLLIRHAEPLRTAGVPADRWPLSDKGRQDARELGSLLARRILPSVVWTSPERRANETAEVVFPASEATLRHQLREVEKPWYESADEHTQAAARYLQGEGVDGWERHEDVIARMADLTLEVRSFERIALVSHGLLLTTWLTNEGALEDPSTFWSDLGMPDAWELDLEDTSLEQIR